MKRVFFILVLCFFTFSVVCIPTYANGNMRINCVDIENTQVIEGQTKEADKNVTIVKYETKSHIKPVQEDKIFHELQDRMENTPPAEKIKVRVCLDYNSNITVDKFLEDAKDLTENMEIENRTAYAFYANLNCEQIEKLAKLKEVKYINLPSKAKVFAPPLPSLNTTNERVYDKVGIKLNAATEMTGAKQAREDFNVTGDGDGNETSYSINDVVTVLLWQVLLLEPEREIPESRSVLPLVLP